MTPTKGKGQHTPGPWVCHSGMVWKDGPNVYPKGTEDGIPIAQMCREPNNGTLPVERDANALLISSAPSLLEALKSILAMADYCPDAKWFPEFDGVAFSRDSDGWKKAEAAIKLAEGE